MEIIYCTTPNFIRHQGNMVDLAEYRRRLARAQAGQGPAAGEEGVSPARQAAAPGLVGAPARPAASPERGARPSRRRALPGLALDWAASAAVIITALTFAAKIL